MGKHYAKEELGNSKSTSTSMCLKLIVQKGREMIFSSYIALF